MYNFIFSRKSLKTFDSLDSIIKNRIISKLHFFKQVDNILPFLKSVENLEPATHRLRVGNFRLLIVYKGCNDIVILKIGLRGDIYK